MLVVGLSTMVDLTEIQNARWSQDFTLRWVLVFATSFIVAMVFNKIISWTIPPIVKAVAQAADRAEQDQKIIRWRRLETFLSVVLAAAKLVLFVVAAYIAWRIFNPHSSPAAIVGASAVFVVIASATVGPLLRDLTYGIIMIAERWYNVGDYIRVEPFMELGGVVEQVTLRSTKLRSVTGEIIWLHNQHIQGVRITPRAARTLAIDVFVTDLEQGKQRIMTALSMVPTGPTTAVRKFKITETEEVGKSLWRITATGQTAPGREWLIEDFAVSAIKKHDSLLDGEDVIVYGPIVRFADDAAERRFKRTVRAKNQG